MTAKVRIRTELLNVGRCSAVLGTLLTIEGGDFSVRNPLDSCTCSYVNTNSAVELLGLVYIVFHCFALMAFC